MAPDDPALLRMLAFSRHLEDAAAKLDLRACSILRDAALSSTESESKLRLAHTRMVEAETMRKVSRAAYIGRGGDFDAYRL